MLGIGFNPRTHTGCDAEISGRIEALSEFQSTHPHGVRHYELKVTDGDAVFQSTHPHGVRLGEVWFCWLGRHGGFNPRTHTGCDSRSYTQHVFIMVSIHAPTRGATLHGPVLRRGIRVSIHAPTRGATMSDTGSRTSCGFQSTHPHGVRPVRIRQSHARILRFNPRTHTGCDNNPYKMRLPQDRFQSTHPHGVRLVIIAILVSRKQHVSIHAPTRGATPQDDFVWTVVTVSIHAPTRGATDVKYDSEMIKKVSIHAPTRGATFWVCGR